MIVNFTNDAMVQSSFSIQWNGGETDRTAVTSKGDTGSIDTSLYNIPNNASCWARAYVIAGPNHDSGGNFTFQPDGATVTYILTGNLLTGLGFECYGCS